MRENKIDVVAPAPPPPPAEGEEDHASADGGQAK
jgi:hypothetical protein